MQEPRAVGWIRTRAPLRPLLVPPAEHHMLWYQEAPVVCSPDALLRPAMLSTAAPFPRTAADVVADLMRRLRRLRQWRDALRAAGAAVLIAAKMLPLGRRTAHERCPIVVALTEADVACDDHRDETECPPPPRLTARRHGGMRLHDRPPSWRADRGERVGRGGRRHIHLPPNHPLSSPKGRGRLQLTQISRPARTCRHNPRNRKSR